jgi:hypothetical protein
MILSNITLNENGQIKFLNIDDEKIKGVIFLKLIDKFFEYIYSDEFNFFSNVMANVSSLKEGRIMILEYKIFKILILHFDKMNNFKIINILRLIRNCCFEFETFHEDILVKDAKLFSLLIKILILTNIDKKKDMQEVELSHIDEIYFTHFNQELAYQDKETINELIVDIFLILTNVKEAVDYMKLKRLNVAIKKIEGRLIEDEKLKDRLFVINNYLEY